MVPGESSQSQQENLRRFPFPTIQCVILGLMGEACFTFTWDKSEESPPGQLKFVHLEEKLFTQSELKTMWVSCLFDLQTQGPLANLSGMCSQDLFAFLGVLSSDISEQSTASFLITQIVPQQCRCLRNYWETCAAEVNRTLRYDGPQSSVTNPVGMKHFRQTFSLENLQ